MISDANPPFHVFPGSSTPLSPSRRQNHAGATGNLLNTQQWPHLTSPHAQVYHNAYYAGADGHIYSSYPQASSPYTGHNAFLSPHSATPPGHVFGVPTHQLGTHMIPPPPFHPIPAQQTPSQPHTSDSQASPTAQSAPAQSQPSTGRKRKSTNKATPNQGTAPPKRPRVTRQPAQNRAVAAPVCGVGPGTQSDPSASLTTPATTSGGATE